MRTTLTDLAQELIEQICDKVAYQYNTKPEEIRNQLSALRLVCRQLRYPPEAHLFRDLTIDGPKKRALSFLTGEQCVEYMDDHKPVFHYCKVLRVRLGLRPRSSIKLPGMSDAYIGPIISGFKQLRSVEWYVEASDPCPLIVEALNILPNLHTLLLRFKAIPFKDLRFETLTKIAKLSISDVQDPRHAQETLKQLSQALETNKSLTHIAIDLLNNTAARFPFPAFPKPTEDAPFPCPLQFLKLRSCGFRFKGRPQLGALTHLEIEHLHFPDNSNIWPLLSMADVKLKTIVVDSTTTPLVDYLLSYSGLEKFSLASRHHPHPWLEDPQELCSPETFYNRILPLHKDSIRSLSLNKLSPKDWEPSGATTAPLLQCRELTTLSVDVGITGVLSLGSLNQMLTTLLKFPKLTSVGIFWEDEEPRFGVTSNLTHFVWGVERNITEFKLPRHDVFKISTRSNFFEAQLSGGGYRWVAGPIQPLIDVAVGLGWAL